MTRLLFCFILLSTYYPLSLAQGPIDGYMKGEAEADFALSYGYEHYTRYYLGGERQDTFDRTYQSLGMFLAFGLDKDLTFIATLPYVHADPDNKGLQDAQIFIKYRPYSRTTDKSRWDVITAAGLTASISNYPVSPASQNPIGERPTILEARVLTQYNSYSGWFIMAQSGLSYKVKPITVPIIPNVLRVGYGHQHFYTDLWIDATFALGAGTNDVPLGQEGSSFIKFGGTFYVPVSPDFGVFANAAYTAWGRNIGIAPRFGFGFVYKYLPKKEKTSHSLTGPTIHSFSSSFSQ